MSFERQWIILNRFIFSALFLVLVWFVLYAFELLPIVMKVQREDLRYGDKRAELITEIGALRDKFNEFSPGTAVVLDSLRFALLDGEENDLADRVCGLRACGGSNMIRAREALKRERQQKRRTHSNPKKDSL